jgi:arylsulfatase A-like enzyme
MPELDAASYTTLTDMTLGAYLGGAARGMPTPSLDRLAAEGMMFTDLYA